MEGVYVGRPPGVGIRPSSGQEKKEKADLDFLGVLIFFFLLLFHEKQALKPQETRMRKVRQRF